jgi:hypothetical protein
MRIRRIDANQPEAVDYLRRAGYGVFITSAVGGGFPDLVCARERFTALVELKDEQQPPSKRRLTLPEQAFRNTWPGVCITAISGEDAWKQLELARMRGKK